MKADWEKDWTRAPPIVHSLVQDQAEMTRQTGFAFMLNKAPEKLISVLSSLMNLDEVEYCHQICAWFEEHLMDSDIANEWWSIRGQDWAYYHMVLQAECPPDGLEIWAACLASHSHINVIQHGQIWSSRVGALQETDPTFVLTPEGVQGCTFVGEQQLVVDPHVEECTG